MKAGYISTFKEEDEKQFKRKLTTKTAQMYGVVKGVSQQSGPQGIIMYIFFKCGLF